MHAYEVGLEVFLLPPESGSIPPCGVCGGALEVTRDQRGPTGFAAALAARHGDDEVRARVATRHDLARCPAAGESWHRHARALALEARRTASPSVRALIEADLAEALADR